MGDDDNGSNLINSSGFIVIFSFVSVMFLFLSMMIIGGFNNYAIGDVLNVINTYINLGLMPSFLGATADETAETLINIVPYMDYLWFASFVSMVISGLVFSYNRKRENYFSLFTMSVLGIILFTYVGSFIIQLTDWFKTEILLAVFPTLSGITPIFSWYLANMGIINLVLICLNIIANFVDLDFSKFNKRKEGESLDEI